MTDSVHAKATATVEHVSKDLDAAKDKDATFSALDKFQKEVEAHMKTLNPEEQKKYMEEVVADLTKNKKLPMLALAYASDKLGANLDENDIKTELRAEHKNLNAGDNRAILTKSMLKYLADNHSDIISASNDEWFSETSITHADVDAKLKQLRERRDEDKRIETNQKHATNSAVTLLSGGKDSLFNFLDKDKTGGITKSELEKYVKDVEECKCTGGQYTPEKIQFVKDLLKSWDDPNGAQWLRKWEPNLSNRGATNGSYGAITRESLLNATGKKSESELNLAANKAANAENTPENQRATDNKPATQNPPNAGDSNGKKPESGNGKGNNPADKSADEIARLATARAGEGFSHIAIRLLGLATPEATPAEIEKAFTGLSAEDKQRVMNLARALEKANKAATNRNVLWVKDVIPTNSADVQAILNPKK